MNDNYNYNDYELNEKNQIKKYIGLSIVTGGLIGIGAFIAKRYRIANPSQYIVRTGLGIKNVSITKQALQWPFQKAITMSMAPDNYSFRLSAMSKEKMEFILPGVFTVGPEDNDNSLRKYATLLNDGVNLQELVKGIVEGETRIVAASMDIEEIFNGRESFRKNIINTVQVELAKFGLLIYNANIKEMEDSVGSEYFGVVRQKKKAEAENTARRDIADAKYQGDIGVKEKERDTRVQVSQFEADSILAENSNQIEMSKSISLMEVQKADFDRQAKIAQIEAQKASEIRNIELQRELDQKKIAQETERLRSIYMSQAIVDAEAKERSADATLYAAQKEAEAIRAKFDAQAEGLRNLLSCTPDTNTILLYTMIEKGTMKDLAEQNAKAINGLNPRIWITGDTGNTNPIGDIMKTLPPLMSTLYEQTGIKPPGWVVDMKKFDKLTK